MSRTAEQPSNNLLETASDYLVGGGILTMALFPLAIPMVALLIVAALPLLLIAVPLALIAAAVALPVAAFRAIRRGLGRPRGRRPESATIAGSRPAMGAHG